MSDPWFEPKRYGYGAGLPIAWQGWALMAAYSAVVVALAVWLAPGRPAAFGAAVAVLTILLLPVTAAKTRGGWRWRWGGDDAR